MSIAGHVLNGGLLRWPAVGIATAPATTAPRDATRDLRLDVLRGFCVFMMVVDHIGGHSWLSLLTGGNQFVVSAAEGFVFISGLVFGMVSAKRVQRHGLPSAMLAALRRSLTLYFLTIVLTLVFATYVSFLGLPWGWQLQAGRPLDVLLSVLTLYRTFYLVDVLLLYTLLLLVAPALLFLLARRRAGWVLAGSWLLWVAYQISPVTAGAPWRPADGQGFQFAPWQVLFVTGLVIGYHREWLASRLRGLPRRRVLALLAAPASLLFLAVPGVGSAPLAGLGLPAIDSAFFSKESLGPGRLIAFAIVFSLAYLASDLCWPQIQATIGRIMLPLGQNALYAYTVQFGVIALVVSGQLERVGYDSQRFAVNTFFQCVAVALIWLAIRRRFLFNVIPR